MHFYSSYLLKSTRLPGAGWIDCRRPSRARQSTRATDTVPSSSRRSRLCTRVSKTEDRNALWERSGLILALTIQDRTDSSTDNRRAGSIETTIKPYENAAPKQDPSPTAQISCTYVIEEKDGGRKGKDSHHRSDCLQAKPSRAHRKVPKNITRNLLFCSSRD